MMFSISGGGAMADNVARFEKLNEQIELPSNVRIPLVTMDWPHDGPRRASINSFGFGGANAHGEHSSPFPRTCDSRRRAPSRSRRT